MLRHKCLFLTWALAVLALPIAAQEVREAEYHYSTRKLFCDGNQAHECKLKPAIDDAIRFRVCEAPVGFLNLTVTAVDLPGFALTPEQQKQLGIGTGTPQSGGDQQTEVTDTPATAQEIIASHQSLREAVQNLANWVSSPNGSQAFLDRERQLRLAHDNFIRLLRPDSQTPAGIVSELRERLKDRISELVFSNGLDPVSWFTAEADLMQKAAQGLGCFSPDTFNVEVPFDIKLVFKSTNVLVKDPPADTIPIRFPTWKITGSTGFAFSGLSDNHYTVRTVTVSPAQGTTPAVTKRVAVLEDRDSYRPEVTGFIHFTKVGTLFNLNSWLLPRQLSVGGGLSTGLSGRIYLGASWPLGRVGSLTFGLAGGQVKRLSKNIDPNDLGTTDPEASRRDVIRTSAFFGISWRVMGATNR